MNFWEESKSVAKDAFDAASKKTDEIVSIQKIKYKLYKIEKQLEELYESLGRLEYDLSKSEISDDELKKSIISDIDELLVSYGETEQALNNAKGVKICSECKEVNKDDAAFCSSCGAKLQ